MEMPKVGDAHRRIHRLAGHWTGEEKLAPSPWGPGGPALGRTTNRVAVDDFFVVGDYEEEKDGHVVFRAHQVFGIDPQTQDVVWYWLDSMGMPPPQPARGTWTDENTLVLQSQSPMGTGRYTFVFDGEKRYRFTLENSRDGKTFTEMMRGDYRKA
jgi:hypothetical protein